MDIDALLDDMDAMAQGKEPPPSASGRGDGGGGGGGGDATEMPDKSYCPEAGWGKNVWNPFVQVPPTWIKDTIQLPPGIVAASVPSPAEEALRQVATTTAATTAAATTAAMRG